MNSKLADDERKLWMATVIAAVTGRENARTAESVAAQASAIADDVVRELRIRDEKGIK